ncbi:hypothetical protein [Streptomyces sp. H27-D2]|uniref:hypothetical protein n=1 Tax=Streptomyces sp. H27-D2 TaxID=3046304 RepID=UPI002DB605D6|nr:hypothetical protein [Streptomyces sp. H27-D2]MEC4017227.1 hypothetical protein [Streptomyces sp. H27-D2]
MPADTTRAKKPSAKTDATRLKKQPSKAAKKQPPAKTHRHQAAPSTSALGASKLAQVRLRPDEMAALHEVMQTLNLGSTSDALREGLRLLVREAAEVAASEEIRDFYQGATAPTPDGVVPASEEELAAADEADW